MIGISPTLQIRFRVPESLAFHTRSDTPHLVNSVKRVLVVTARKLGNVTVWMPTRHVVVRSVIAPHHPRPQALIAVRVCRLPDVLPDTILDRFVILKARVCFGIADIHLHALLGIFIQRPLARSCSRAVRYLAPNLLKPLILYSCKSHLANGAASSIELFASMLVLLTAADLRLINLYRATKELLTTLALARHASGVRQMPRRLLRDVQVAVLLHTGHTLVAGDDLANGNPPHLVAQA